MCIQADPVAVGRALIAALLFVGKRPASFSEAKFNDTEFGSVLKRRRTHWTSLWAPQIAQVEVFQSLENVITQRVTVRSPG